MKHAAGADDTPTVEIPACPKCHLPVELGTCCRGCGVYFGDPCASCGQAGYHADDCAESNARGQA